VKKLDNTFDPNLIHGDISKSEIVWPDDTKVTDLQHIKKTFLRDFDGLNNREGIYEGSVTSRYSTSGDINFMHETKHTLLGEVVKQKK